MMSSDGWEAYKCRCGETLFLYNVCTNKHKWVNRTYMCSKTLPPCSDEAESRDAAIDAPTVDTYQQLHFTEAITHNKQNKQTCSCQALQQNGSCICCDDTAPPVSAETENVCGSDSARMIVILQQESQSSITGEQNIAVSTNKTQDHETNKSIAELLAAVDKPMSAFKDIDRIDVTKEVEIETRIVQKPEQTKQCLDSNQNHNQTFCLKASTDGQVSESVSECPSEGNTVVILVQEPPVTIEPPPAQKPYLSINQGVCGGKETDSNEMGLSTVLVTRDFSCESQTESDVEESASVSNRNEIVSKGLEELVTTLEVNQVSGSNETNTDLSVPASRLKVSRDLQPRVRPLVDKTQSFEYRRAQNMSQYLETTPEGKRYKCPECGKLVKQSGTLTIHMRMHSGLKPFQCSRCGKVYRASGALTEHMLTHLSEYPFKCVDCGLSFRSKYIKQKHIAHAHKN